MHKGTLSRAAGKKAKAKIVFKPNQVFGIGLHELAERDGKAIPSIVTHSIAHIEAKGLEIQGIFRVSGIQTEVDALRDRYDDGEEVNLKDKDIHNVTSLLKLYFRELPEPLLTFQLYQHCLAISQYYTNEERKPLYYRVLVHSLPIYNRLVLLKLLAFLYTCSLKEEVNSMTADNLALVFSVNILRPLICNEKVLFTESTKINKAVSEFIKFAEELSVKNADEQNLFDRVGCLNGNVEVDKEGGGKVKLEKGDIVFIYGSTDESMMKVEHDGDVLMVPNDSIHQHVSTTPVHKPLAKPATSPSSSNKQRSKPNFSSRAKEAYKEQKNLPRRAPGKTKQKGGSNNSVAISSPTPIAVDQARHPSSRLPHTVPTTSSSPASLSAKPVSASSWASPSTPAPSKPPGNFSPAPQLGTKKAPPPRPAEAPPKVEEEGGNEGEWVEEWVVEESWVVDDGGFCLCEHVYELEAQMAGCLEEIDRANRQYLLTLEDVRQARYEMNQLLAQLTSLTKNYTLTPKDPNAPPTPISFHSSSPSPSPRTSPNPAVGSPRTSPKTSPRGNYRKGGGRYSSTSSLSSLGSSSPRGAPSPLSSSQALDSSTIGSFSSSPTHSPSPSPTPLIPPKPKASTPSPGSSPRTPQRSLQPPPKNSPSSLSAPFSRSSGSSPAPPPSPRKPPPPRPSVAPPSMG